jgi:hypothetical protein
VDTALMTNIIHKSLNNMIGVLKIGLSGLKTSDLIAKCKSIEAKMVGNALFANPVPALADVAAARALLEEHASASRFGDRESVARRRTQEKLLTDMLRKLGAYVAAVANLPEDVLSAGFDVRKQPEPPSALLRPVGLEARRSDKAGEVDIAWKKVSGSQHYLLEMCTADPTLPGTSWSLMAYTSRARYQVGNLTPGTWYWFRVMAMGTAGQSPYSDPATVMAA